MPTLLKAGRRGHCCVLLLPLVYRWNDGTIEAAETVTVNASEEQFGISPAMTDLYRKWDSAYANRNVQ
ncbi:MAG: hypothetical protein OSA89_01785 [Mariniblastus sp.]|nr:hypothetical protein [Mariniblastus sp.]